MVFVFGYCVTGLLVWFCGCWLCVICVGGVGLGCVSYLFGFWMLVNCVVV